MIEGVGGDSGESEWWVAGVRDGCVEWGIGKRRRHWPGGGRGGIPLEGIASPGVGRTRLEEPQRIGRQAPRMTGNSKSCGCSYEFVAICPEAWAVTWGKSVDEAAE